MQVNDPDGVIAVLRAEATRRGYRFEESETEIRMIRPDGTVAVTARRPNSSVDACAVSSRGKCQALGEIA